MHAYLFKYHSLTFVSAAFRVQIDAFFIISGWLAAPKISNLRKLFRTKMSTLFHPPLSTQTSDSPWTVEKIKDVLNANRIPMSSGVSRADLLLLTQNTCGSSPAEDHTAADLPASEPPQVVDLSILDPLVPALSKSSRKC